MTDPPYPPNEPLCWRWCEEEDDDDEDEWSNDKEIGCIAADGDVGDGELANGLAAPLFSKSKINRSPLENQSICNV